MNAWRHAAPLIALGVLATDGCSAASSEDASPSGFGGDSPENTGGSSSGGSGASTGGGSGSSSGGSTLPPEMKAENKFKAPVATGNFVWTANPTSGRVAYINATTFNVQTTPAGNGPTYLAAVADATDDVAVVLNVLSEDATLLRVGPQGALTTQTYASTADANSWAISASGHWGIAWTDATFVDNPDPTQGFQSVAVMDLSATVPDPQRPAPSTLLAVGYRPVEVAFSSDDARAFAVTEDGISVIDLKNGTPTVLRQDPLSAPANSSPLDASASTGDASGSDAAGDDGSAGGTASGAPDVSFTPDGAYALVRRDGLSTVTIDALADGTLTTIPLPSASIVTRPGGE